MRNRDGKLVGILGTVILHLIAAIIFMLFQISSLQKYRTEEFAIEVAPVEEAAPKEKLVELPTSSVEKILRGDQEMLNIARNIANTEKGDQKVDPAEIINKVKDELIKSGKLGADNFIDEQKKIDAGMSEDKVSVEKDTASARKAEKTSAAKSKPTNYKGPTRIYYNLPGRTHTYLPIPIYMCEGSGKVVLAIDVNQKGEVEKAQILANESTTSDPCLIETAISTALSSRFNPDVNSPGIEPGTLTYQFVAQ